MISSTSDDLLAAIGRDIDLAVESFNKAYRIIESCKTIEQLDMARSYIDIVEGIMIERMLPICQVLHTMIAVRIVELNSNEE